MLKEISHKLSLNFLLFIYILYVALCCSSSYFKLALLICASCYFLYYVGSLDLAEYIISLVLFSVVVQVINRNIQSILLLICLHSILCPSSIFTPVPLYGLRPLSYPNMESMSTLPPEFAPSSNHVKPPCFLSLAEFDIESN